MYHQGHVLSVGWMDTNMFASGSADGTVCVCTLGMRTPVKKCFGHEVQQTLCPGSIVLGYKNRFRSLSLLLQ